MVNRASFRIWRIRLSTKLSHIEINVSDYARSIRFYDLILRPLGWKRTVCTKEFTSYSDGHVKVILCPAEQRLKTASVRRHPTGISHFAFSASSREAVDEFHKSTLEPAGISTLSGTGPSGSDDYYAVYFEDPDRLKLEVVYAPRYCEPSERPNRVFSDFDPYGNISLS